MIRRLIVRALIGAVLVGGGAYGSLAYTAYKHAPKGVKENRYVTCATQLDRVRVNPARAASKPAQRKAKRCARTVRSFERRHGDRARQLVGKAGDVELDPRKLF